MPLLLTRLAELDSILDSPLLACKLTELLQAVLELDQLKVSFYHGLHLFVQRSEHVVSSTLK